LPRLDRLCRSSLGRAQDAALQNQGGDSGVVAYDIDAGSITVQFRDGGRYLYTIASAGAANIAEMQRLARSGRGLCSFISRVTKDHYERKLD
jgi:hypothetical protein